ncbi:UNVERIFIED_CONTAM: hypothetical protein DES50_11128 [Williamsia faeni]
MHVSHRYAADSAVFDDDNRVSHAGVIPVLTLAQQSGLHQLLAVKVWIRSSVVASAGVM